MTLLLFLVIALTNPVKLEEVSRFETVPNHLGKLQFPGSLCLDDRGCLYVFDAQTRVIYAWDQDGRFRLKFSVKGQGPAKFGFDLRVGGIDLITARGDSIYLYLVDKRQVLVFSRGGVVQQTIAMDKVTGPTNSFAVTKQGTLILAPLNFHTSRPSRDVCLFNANGNMLKKFYAAIDPAFTLLPGSGPNRSIQYRAFSPVTAATYVPEMDEVAIIDPAKVLIKLFDMETSQYRTVKLDIRQGPVGTADKREFQRNAQFQEPSYSVIFPKFKPHFDRVLALGTKGFLVLKQSPYERRLEGILVDRKGTKQGDFKETLGKNGLIHAAHGFVYTVKEDEAGQWLIRKHRLIF